MKPAVRIDAYEQGVKDERERIITLLTATLKIYPDPFAKFIIALIKGKENA